MKQMASVIRRGHLYKGGSKMNLFGYVRVSDSSQNEARQLIAMQEQWRIITKEKGADIVVLDMPLLDTREKERDLTGRLIADIVLQLLSYCAQKERESIRQRQAEGIAAAKLRGVRFGRPSAQLPANFGELVHHWECGALPFEELLTQCKMSRSTFYKHLAIWRVQQDNK